MSSGKFDDNFCVLVLGDIGRSPRIVNHIVELAENSPSTVDVICYRDTSLPPSLEKLNIRVSSLSSWLLSIVRVLPGFLYVMTRFWVEALQIFYLLFFRANKRYGCILVQNPPSFHIMMVLHIYKVIKSSCIIIDIHNYGYTIYQTRNPLVRKVLKFLEIFWLKLTGNGYLTVSQAMAKDVQDHWRLNNVVVLYDKPNKSVFRPISLLEKHYFLEKFVEFVVDRHETFFTRLEGDTIVEKKNRPLLLLSNSSFSIDDDYESLLQALQMYDERLKTRKLVLVMSGQGPCKQNWQRRFERTHFNNINVIFKWFEAKDYPLIVASADYGICMHNSTSGVDLPIKILDLQSCKVPVLAYEYSSTIREQVTEGKNGYLFRSSADLSDLLTRVASGTHTPDWVFDDRDWKTEWKRNFYKVL